MKTSLVFAPAWVVAHPPVNVAILSSVLKNKGYAVRCFDLNIELYNVVKNNTKVQNSFNISYWDGDKIGIWENKEEINELFKEYNKEIDIWVSSILSEKPQIVGFTTYYISLLFSIELAERIKKISPQTIIVFGGPVCFPHEKGKEIFSLTNAVDYICYTEGEIALIDLIERIDKGEKNPIVKGFYSKSEEKIITGDDCGFISDLNTIPFADFSNFKLDKYTERTLPINTSRGCINRCTFCNESPFWGRFRVRTAENVFKEITHLKKLYPKTQHLWFTDSLINGNIGMLKILCDLMIESKIQIKWIASSYIRKEMDLLLLKKIKESGCDSLLFGLENGSNEVLKLMRKGYDAKLAKTVLKNSVKAGIDTYANIIVGHPGETHKNFLQTVRFILFFLNLNHIKTTSFNDCHLIQGSVLFRNMDAYSIKVKNYSYNDWYSDDGKNNYFIRKLRVDSIKSLAFYYKRSTSPITNFKINMLVIFRTFLNPINIYRFFYFELYFRFISKKYNKKFIAKMNE